MSAWLASRRRFLLLLFLLASCAATLLLTPRRYYSLPLYISQRDDTSVHADAFLSASDKQHHQDSPIAPKTDTLLATLRSVAYTTPPTKPTGAHVPNRYWEQFLLWDRYQRPQFGPEVGARAGAVRAVRKRLTYRCDKTIVNLCGGWADRIKV